MYLYRRKQSPPVLSPLPLFETRFVASVFREGIPLFSLFLEVEIRGWKIRGDEKGDIYIYINFLIYAPVHGRGFIAYGLVFYRSIKSSLSISFKILSKNCNVIKNIIDERE